ncbi:hypothetical protein C8A05DRAFT_17566, partial [Staphylotrichum tortipilum]
VIFLVSRGADVWATDCTGRSVSHVVYSPTVTDKYLGSYRRDLWDLALAANGYDVLKVRGNTRRVSHFNYTRAHFRQLWAGREHLCHYPEDLEDTASDEDQEEAVEDEDGSSEDVSYWREDPDARLVNSWREDPDAGQVKPNAEDFDPEDFDPEDFDPEDFEPEHSDAEDPNAEDSDFGGSSTDGSEGERCTRCNTLQMGSPHATVAIGPLAVKIRTADIPSAWKTAREREEKQAQTRITRSARFLRKLPVT